LAVQSIDVGQWRLVIRRDTFSGGQSCRLYARDHRAFYQAGAVALRFPRRWDVSEAAYRVDGGWPRSARDDLPDLVRMGVPFDTGSVQHPSGGLLWIPIQRVTGAAGVWAEPATNRSLRYYTLAGLAPLRVIGLARGCPADFAFVR
jgi:hypothetical protein